MLLRSQNAVFGVVAASGTGFAQDVYYISVQACGRAGGCNILPLTVNIQETVVLSPNSSFVCYIGLVSACLS